MLKPRSILVFVLFVVFLKAYSGCQNPYFYATDGIKGWSNNGWSPIVSLTDKTDSSTFVIILYRGEGSTEKKTATDFAVIFNGDTVFKLKGTVDIPGYGINVKLPAKEGVYETCGIAYGCLIQAINLHWTFELKVKIKEPPVRVYPDSVKVNSLSETALSEAESPEPFSMLFNREAEKIWFQNLGEGIKTITVYNMSGQMIQTITTLETSTNLPLSSNLIGLYYVHVAMQSEKVVIRKIFIQ